MALNTLTADFLRSPLKFMRAKSVNPPGIASKLKGKRTIPLNQSNMRFFDKPVWAQQEKLQDRFKAATTGTPIGWINLMPDIVFPGAITFDVEFASDQGDFENRVTAENRLPVYYLPWKPDHLLRMQIPRYRTETISPQFGGATDLDPYSPHIFFTAGLSGCSIFVYGDPREPVVTHAGTNTSTPYGDNAARFWREILLVERFQRLQHIGVAHEANANEYMGNTPAMQAFQSWLTTQPTEFTVEHAINSGSVFGIRYGASWTFYLQENLGVIRFKIVNKSVTKTKQVSWVETEKGFLSSLGVTAFDKQVTKTGTISKVVTVQEKVDGTRTVPISVRPFYPSYSGRADFWETFRQTYS